MNKAIDKIQFVDKLRVSMDSLENLIKSNSKNLVGSACNLKLEIKERQKIYKNEIDRDIENNNLFQ